jgi:hypothetical protein
VTINLYLLLKVEDAHTALMKLAQLPVEPALLSNSPW